MVTAAIQNRPRVTMLPILCLTAGFPAPGLSQFSRDSPVKRSVRGPLLLLKPERRQLEGIQNITEIHLGQAGYCLVVGSGRSRVFFDLTHMIGPAG